MRVRTPRRAAGRFVERCRGRLARAAGARPGFRRSQAPRPRTSASSAAVSPASGRRCTRRPPTQTATSCCRGGDRGPAPADATAASVASLTHGIANGLSRFRVRCRARTSGPENFHALRATSMARDRFRFRGTGELTVALEPHELAWLDQDAAPMRRFGHEADSSTASRCAPRSRRRPTVGGLWDATGPRCSSPQARRRAARRRPGRRRPRVRAPPARGCATRAPPAGRASHGGACGRRVLLGTSAYAPLAACDPPLLVPVYDYVLVTEPLTDAQLGDDRLAAAPGSQRRRQPVSLLPPHRR